ncbi:MAG: flagellin hook IN motif-containing protein, partial [Planctomycetota bacterium]
MTVQDFIDAVHAGVTTPNFPSGGAVTVTIEAGNVLRFTDNTTGASPFRILDGADAGGPGATVATDLGIRGSFGAGNTADTIDTNPAKGQPLGGFGPGAVNITTHDGTTAAIDFTTARSVSDVIKLINTNADLDLSASLNSAGNGIVVTDNTIGGSHFIVEDAAGNLATMLGIATGPGGTADSSVGDTDLDLRYLSEATRLDSLNANRGVSTGSFNIIDSVGVATNITLNDNDTTLDDVIAKINTASVNVTAAINSTGDGIILTDIGGGANLLTVEEDGSSTAKDLGILGTANTGDTFIDGSFEKTVTIEATDTLDDVADKINAADVGVAASIINDGSGSNAYRLTLSSEYSGVAGRILFDDGGLGLATSDLVRGDDAVVFFGSSDPADAL